MLKKKKEDDKVKRQAWRPTKYPKETKEFLQMVTNYCLLGCTDIELAEFLGICEKTLNVYKIKHPNFIQSIRAGKEQADAMIASKLFKRANGYTTKEKTFTIPFDAEGTPIGKKPEHSKTVEKEVIPDVSAQIFWLKNRRSGKWSNKDNDSVDTTLEAYDFDYEEIDSNE